MNVLACAFCLSSDRNLFFMEERRSNIVLSLFDDNNIQYMKYLQSSGSLRACWCCQARVKSFERFALSAQRSLRTLRDYLTSAQVNLTSQSSLCKTELDVVDIPPLPLKPEPQSSQLPAKGEQHTEGSILCELVQLPTAVKLENDSLDRNYSDDELTTQENDNFKTESSKAKLHEENGTKKVKGAVKKKAIKKKKTRDISKPSFPGKSARWSTHWATEEQARCWHEQDRAADLPAGLVCGHCRRGTFRSQEELATHFRDCHDESVGAYECNICRYRFASLAPLRRHIARHFTSHNCVKCPFVTRSLRDVTRHCETAHARGGGGKKSFVCMRCKESFASAVERRTHRASCRTYVCAAPQCARTFTNVSTYYDHRASHKEGAQEDLYCHVCDKQFTSSKWFKTHFRTSLKHVSRDSYKHECPHCKLRFHIAQRLKEHVAAKHMNRGLYACDLCTKSFSINKTLKKHRARVHNIGSIPPPARDKVCEHCGKAFTSTLFLNDHMRIHTGEKPFKCTLCPAAFAQNGTLYIHTLAAHKKKLRKDGLTDSPSYQCAECGKQFPSGSRMRTHHNSVHLKLSRHNCDTCNVAFSSATSLKNHLAGRHGVLAGDALKCDACGKIYNTSSALRAHALRHAQPKQVHKCRACAAEFKSSSGLQLHFKYVHLKLKRNDKVSLKNVGDPDKELLINGEPQTVTQA